MTPMGGNRGNELGDVVFVFIVLLRFYGVSIIPKWLIKVPGHIPIFLDDFGNFDFLSKSGPVDLLIITKCFNEYKKHYGIIIFHI